MIESNKLVEKVKTSRVYDVACKTPLERMELMSARLENDVYIKREDQQEIFSFKIRGAYNKISALSAGELKKGIIGA